MKVAWLQVTGREPRPFKTKGGAVDQAKAEIAAAVERGWVKHFGSVAKGFCVLRNPETAAVRAVVVSVVDGDGYELPTRGRRCKSEYIGVAAT